MPEISRFLGIVVAIIYNDHDPPHFHVRYGSKKAISAPEFADLSWNGPVSIKTNCGEIGNSLGRVSR